MRCASTTCITSPARVYSRMRSTASMKLSRPNPETKSASSGGRFACVRASSGTGSERRAASFASRSRASSRALDRSGSTMLMSCIRPRTLSKTITSLETISRTSGVPRGSGGVESASRRSMKRTVSYPKYPTSPPVNRGNAPPPSSAASGISNCLP